MTDKNPPELRFIRKKLTPKNGIKSISIPAEVLAKMQKHPEINWSAVAVESFVDLLELMETES